MTKRKKAAKKKPTATPCSRCGETHRPGTPGPIPGRAHIEGVRFYCKDAPKHPIFADVFREVAPRGPELRRQKYGPRAFDHPPPGWQKRGW